MKSATTANWRAAYRQAYEENFKSQHPVAYKDHGLPIIKFPEVNKANGITQVIINFLKWSGHYANRINSQGQVRVEKIQLANGNVRNNAKWTKGTTNAGTADILASYKGRMIFIEIKCEATKDRVSKDQLREKERVEKSGGIYLIVKSVEHFFELYKVYFNG